MSVSVIIPTYNEERYITDCLRSLEKQTLKDFEVIVVDDGSTDNSKSKIQSFKLQSKNKRLIYLEQNHKGPGAARNSGVKVAIGDILVFLDADMIFEKHFLNNLVSPIFKGKCKGTFSKDEYVSNWENKWSRCWNINEGWEKKKRHPKNYPSTQKVFRAILKSEFNKVGGFTPGGYTDDYSLSEKLGYMALAADKAIFYHKNPETLSEVFTQAKWAAKRKYKLGVLGLMIAILRVTFPLPLFIGLFKSVLSLSPEFVVFKLVHDLGASMGIFELITLKKMAR